MKTLLLMRHAKSSWDYDELDDFSRPLNARGYRDATRMGNWLLKNSLLPDVIISSSAIRAASTAALVANRSDIQPKILLTQQLYDCTTEGFFKVIEGVSDTVSTALVVSHNPTLEEFTALLSGVECELPTATIIKFELDLDRWENIRRLDHHQKPEFASPKTIEPDG